MFKLFVLQKFHGLSDDATEEQIFDCSRFASRLRSKNFLRLRIGGDIPDAKALGGLQATHRRGRACRQNPALRSLRQMLEGKCIFVREGSIVDASFVGAPRQRNDRERNRRIKQGERPEEFDANPAVGRQKDSEARWAKKNSEANYGRKNHVKADLKTKLILTSTPPLPACKTAKCSKQCLMTKTSPCWPTVLITARSMRRI